MKSLFKETELGTLPDAWEVAPLGACLTEAQYGISVKGGKEGGCAILRMTNQVNGRVSAGNLQYVNVSGADLAKFRVMPGDLLVNRTNSHELVGRTSIFDIEGDFVFASYLIRIRTVSDRLDPSFLNFYLNASTTQRRLKSIATRAVSQSNISASRLKGFAVPLPPLSEQRRIAAVLTVMCRAVEQQERVLMLTLELKNAILQQLFTAGLHDEPKKKSEVGPVPESWKISPLGAVAKLQTGGTPSRDNPAYWQDGDIPWVKTGEVNYRVINATEEKITREGLAGSAAKVFPAGTLLVAMYGQGITRGRVALLGIDAAANQACAAILPHYEEELSTEFVYYYLQYNYERLRQLAHGTNQANLNMALIRGFHVAYPTPAEQARTVEMLTCLDRKIELCKVRTKLLGDLFRNLLHQLITAQIRVQDLDLSELETALAD